MEKKILWQPDSSKKTNLSIFTDKINEKYNLQLSTYDEMYKWSTENHDLFWSELWDHCGVVSSQSYDQVIDKKQPMDEIPQWFSGAKLNFAENLLKFKADNRIAVYSICEGFARYKSRTFVELHERVTKFAASLRALGVKPKDVVAGYIPNICETVEAVLAATSIGAVWSTASPDFGITGVLERFRQISPKILFSIDAATYNGKIHDHLEKLSQVVKQLPSLEKVIIVPFDENTGVIGTEVVPNSISLDDFLTLGLNADGSVPVLVFEQVPFNHPLYIMFSSGTTGVPKCMVHSVGGTLLKHLEEHKLQANVCEDDLMMFFTTTGWMMWNWTISILALGAALVLYDGSPLYPNSSVMWDIIDKLKVTILGTGAKWLAILEEKGIKPKQTHQLTSLRSVLSTGSPLPSHSFEYIYRDVSENVLLGSITGGTDLIGCFAGLSVDLPLHLGEIQCRFLGMAVECWDDEGKPLLDESGELVCVKPFPSMPTHFLNDPSGTKYYNAYFNKFPHVWCHGDFCQIGSKTGGVVLLGRSDGTLNPNGVRFGSAEIYNIVEEFKEIQDSLCVAQMNKNGEERVILFLKMARDCLLSNDLVKQVQAQIRKELTARHVPAFVLETKEIPYTTNGKKVEIAVRKILSGSDVTNKNALANPESLDLYVDIPELRNF